MRGLHHDELIPVDSEQVSPTPAKVCIDDRAGLAAVTLLGLEAIERDADRKSVPSLERFVGMILALGFVHGVAACCIHTQAALARFVGLDESVMVTLVHRAAARTGRPVPNGKSAHQRAAVSAAMRRPKKLKATAVIQSQNASSKAA